MLRRGLLLTGILNQMRVFPNPNIRVVKQNFGACVERSGPAIPYVYAVVVYKFFTQRILLEMLAWEIGAVARISAALWRIREPENPLPGTRFDAVSTYDKVRYSFGAVAEHDGGLRPFLISVIYNLTPHAYLDTGIPHGVQKYGVVVTPVSDISRHVHQGLHRQDLAIVPSPDLHVTRLIAYFS